MTRAAKTTKSYTGCRRCKARKVKCDETEPECQACVKAGVTCSGFQQAIRWSSKHEKFVRREAPMRQPPPLSSSSGSASQSATQPNSQCQWLDSTPWNSMMLTNLEYLNLPGAETGQFPNLSLTIPPGEVSFPFDMSLASTGMWSPVEADATRLSPLDDSGAALGPSDSHITYTDLSTSPVSPLAGKRTSGQTQHEPNPAGSSSDNTGSKLLGTFYRLSSPSQTPQFSDEHLVKHYFDNVCALCSCFDSALNPFRTLVSKLWRTSTTISLAIQSMAISDLTNHYLYMAPMGRVKRWQSWKSLQRDLQLHKNGKVSLETILLSLLLLGISSTWDQPSNLGLPYLFVARNLLQSRLRGNRAQRPLQPLPNEEFYLESIMYWEMLTSFVDPVPMTSFPGFGAPLPQLPPSREPSTPHPWTATTPELHWALAEVGRLLRRGVRRHYNHNDVEDGIKSWCDDDRRWSVSLEEYIHRLTVPTLDDILDFADKHTPKLDLINTASAHRQICLLELYSAFSDLLVARYPSDHVLPASSPNPLIVPVTGDMEHLHYDRNQNRLCALSLHTLRLVEDMLITSAACRFLPLILVSCSSQLRLPAYENSPTDSQTAYLDEILEARYAIEERMLSLSRKYSQRKMLQILETIKETWQRLDNSLPYAHWLDVAHEKGWQTMMG